MNGDRPTVVTTDLGVRICEALNINPDPITRINIDIRPGALVAVEITRYIYEREVGEILSFVTAYELKPKKQPDGLLRAT